MFAYGIAGNDGPIRNRIAAGCEHLSDGARLEPREGCRPTRRVRVTGVEVTVINVCHPNCNLPACRLQQFTPPGRPACQNNVPVAHAFHSAKSVTSRAYTSLTLSPRMTLSPRLESRYAGHSPGSRVARIADSGRRQGPTIAGSVGPNRPRHRPPSPAAICSAAESFEIVMAAPFKRAINCPMFVRPE